VTIISRAEPQDDGQAASGRHPEAGTLSGPRPADAYPRLHPSGREVVFPSENAVLGNGAGAGQECCRHPVCERDSRTSRTLMPGASLFAQPPDSFGISAAALDFCVARAYEWPRMATSPMGEPIRTTRFRRWACDGFVGRRQAALGAVEHTTKDGRPRSSCAAFLSFHPPDAAAWGVGCANGSTPISPPCWGLTGDGFVVLDIPRADIRKRMAAKTDAKLHRLEKFSTPPSPLGLAPRPSPPEGEGSDAKQKGGCLSIPPFFQRSGR